MKVVISKGTRSLLLASSLMIGTLQSPLAVADDVRYRIIPYLWTAGIDAEVGRPGFTTDVNVSFSDYLDLIDMGAAFGGETKILLSTPAARVGGDNVYLWGDTIDFRFEFGGSAEHFYPSCFLEGNQIRGPFEDSVDYSIPLTFDPDVGGGGGVLYGSLGHRNPNQRIGHPAGVFLRRRRLQADPRTDPPDRDTGAIPLAGYRGRLCPLRRGRRYDRRSSCRL